MQLIVLRISSQAKSSGRAKALCDLSNTDYENRWNPRSGNLVWIAKKHCKKTLEPLALLRFWFLSFSRTLVVACKAKHNVFSWESIILSYIVILSSLVEVHVLSANRWVWRRSSSEHFILWRVVFLWRNNHPSACVQHGLQNCQYIGFSTLHLQETYFV